MGRLGGLPGATPRALVTIDAVELVGDLLEALNALDGMGRIVARLPASLKEWLFIFLNLTGTPPAGNA
jgi:hypothetical protein